MSEQQRRRSSRSLEAERRFRERVAELGGVVLEPRWLGNGKPHRIRCAAGHESTTPRPTVVQRGSGVCRACFGLDPKVAEHAFRERVAKLGGTVLEEGWLGAMTRRRVRCPVGHEQMVLPAGVQQGGGICRTCAGNDSSAAEAAFRATVAELGGEVLEPVWLGVDEPHRIRCPLGHASSPRPANVRRGAGICRACGGKDPAEAERAFRARVAEMGGTVLESEWLGARTPHRVRCSAGHENAPRPTGIQKGGGICRTCAGQDPKTAERAFRDRVAELGGVVLELEWLGARTRHRVRCRVGHECMAMPTTVQRGDGFCRTCTGKAWDVFYVVADTEAGLIKFGITSGDPRTRLRSHARDGFERVLRTLTGLPGSVAPELERSVMATLRLAGEAPARGREYYSDRVTAVVLDTVDNFPVQPLDLNPARRAASVAIPAQHDPRNA